MNTIKTIFDSLKDQEQVQIILQRKGDEASLIIVPALKNSQEKPSEETGSLRAALATPLAMRGQIGEICNDLPGLLKGYIETQASIKESYSVLSQLKEADKKGKEAVIKKKGETSSPQAKIEENSTGPTTEEPPPDTQPNDNPTSLF